MKFTSQELIELTSESGGRFSTKSLDSAIEFCKRITIEHYENFPVASIIIPSKIRNYIYPIYAFARVADDIADELNDTDLETRLNALSNMKNLLINISSLNINTTNPILLSLNWVRTNKKIPIDLFIRLLTAFKMDILFIQPRSLSSLLEYCDYSANPIGELILFLFEEHNEQNVYYSNKICTGLQLINFWQDLSVDLRKGRCYIPIEYLDLYSLNSQNLYDEKNSSKLKFCITQILNDTKEIYNEGFELINRLRNFKLRMEIALTIESGSRMLKKLEELNIELINVRPKLGKSDILPIIYNTISKYVNKKWKQ